MSEQSYVALIAEGTLKNITEIVLGTGEKDKYNALMSKAYPEGQNLRGAFGYTFLEADAGISQTYMENTPAVLYFRDARPRHFRDKGKLMPVMKENRFVNYRCTSCGDNIESPTYMNKIVSIKLDRKTNSVASGAFVKHEAILGRSIFDFRVALNLKRGKEYASEFIAAVEKFSNEYIRLGKRRNKGKGLFTLEDVKYSTVTLNEIKKRAEALKKKDKLIMYFFSDVVVDRKITVEMILRSIKNCAKFMHPEYESYNGPSLKIFSNTLPIKKIVFLDRKEGISQKISYENIIPKSGVVKLQVKDASTMFWEALALTEAFMGIGKRTSFGKGEFKIF